MTQKLDFSYIDADYFSLILKIAANNSIFQSNNNNWELSTIGNLINQSHMISSMQYDDLSYMDTSFITNNYQWLYVYQQLANACNMIVNMPNSIDLSTWHYLGVGGWTNSVNTDYFKIAAKNLLIDFARVAVFPELQNEWLSFFRLLKQHKHGCKTFNSFGISIYYDATKNALLSTEGIAINYYDILYATVSKEGYEQVKHLNKLSFDNYASYFIVQSINDSNLNK